MGEMMKKLPPWARHLLVVVAVAGPVGGAIANSIKTYYEVKDAKRHAGEAHEMADDGYDTLAPALLELQETMDDAELWAEETSDEIDLLVSNNEDTELRLIRCEEFMQDISGRRGMPRLPELVYPDGPKTWPEDPVAAVTNGTLHPHFLATIDAKKEKVAKKHARPVPQSLEKAQDYQQQREEMECPPDDPLCGALP